MHKPSYIAYHVLALVTAAVWGSTFVSTKILLANGLSPAKIMVIRFSIAYLLILLLSHRPLFSRKLSDELLMIGAGITGGSLYFLAENSALIYTQASNVAIIIAVTPLLTAIAAHFFSRGERFSRTLATGSVIALAGVVLVVLNGRFVLHLNPKGDMLTIAAAVLWALYSIIIARLQRRYSSLFITRKVFFYGIVTLLPYLFIHEAALDFGLLLRPAETIIRPATPSALKSGRLTINTAGNYKNPPPYCCVAPAAAPPDSASPPCATSCPAHNISASTIPSNSRQVFPQRPRIVHDRQ